MIEKQTISAFSRATTRKMATLKKFAATEKQRHVLVTDGLYCRID